RRQHSPGRETDDAVMLRRTGKQLESRGFQVLLKNPDEVIGTPDARPLGVFLMCERPGILHHLRDVETSGVPHVNSPLAVFNTYRERMLTLVAEANAPFRSEERRVG